MSLPSPLALICVCVSPPPSPLPPQSFHPRRCGPVYSLVVVVVPFLHLSLPPPLGI
uniref:Uncharacterized protein n=1 Tax=Cucumis melo TaxID=3656 RepID=A0A9I9DTV5_CUCME